MKVFARLVFIAAILFSIPPLVFLGAGLTAPDRIRSEQAVEVFAPPAAVWDIVTDWEILGAGMNKMMPTVGKRRVLGGEQPAPGLVVRYSLADGRQWDQRIVEWDPPRAYSFRNAQGTAAGLPGDVAMTFQLEPISGGYTRVRYRIEVVPDGFVNRAMARVFGELMGTLKGYETAVLEVVKETAEKRVVS